MKRIAVLALQGAFVEHEQMLRSLGAEPFEIRQKADWQQHKDGLIIPGGESTVILKLLQELDLLAPIRHEIQAGLPVFGTCAGLILLSQRVVGEPQERISTMNIETFRNAYGRQLGSFYTTSTMLHIGDNVPMTFIRAPYIREAGSDVEVLAEVGGRIVAARQANQLVTAFHPELNSDSRIHAYFLNEIVSK